MNANDESEILIEDKQGRVIFKIIGDGVMVMRLPDMDEYTKNELVLLYTEFTKENGDKLRKFLNFEDENGENEFCS